MSRKFRLEEETIEAHFPKAHQSEHPRMREETFADFWLEAEQEGKFYIIQYFSGYFANGKEEHLIAVEEFETAEEREQARLAYLKSFDRMKKYQKAAEDRKRQNNLPGRNRGRRKGPGGAGVGAWLRPIPPSRPAGDTKPIPKPENPSGE